MDAANIIALVSVVVTVFGLGGVAVWRLISMIGEVDRRRSENSRQLHEKIESTASSLDTKFNSIRGITDDIKDKYVRRDDLDGHIDRFEKQMEQMTAMFGRQIEQLTSSVDRVRTRFDEGFLELVKALQRVVDSGQGGRNDDHRERGRSG